MRNWFSRHPVSFMAFYLAQQHDAEHSPVCVFLREDIQDGVQQHPADQQREQIPHGAGGKELLPGISSGVGQPQQKAAGHLEGLGDAAGEADARAKCTPP